MQAFLLLHIIQEIAELKKLMQDTKWQFGLWIDIISYLEVREKVFVGFLIRQILFLIYMEISLKFFTALSIISYQPSY